MGRIDATFANLAAQKRKALVIYLTAGDPDVDTSVAAALAAVEAGADVLEIGVPFSDPVADGPVIQRAMLRALERGGGFAQAVEVIKKVRARVAAPIVAFGYANPLLHGGLDASCGQLASAGADGVLIVDVPAEEAGPLRRATASAKLCSVPLLAPTTGIERVAGIVGDSQGFVYVVSMTGVTGGTLSDDSARLDKVIAEARRRCQTPLCVGFGVRDKASAARAARLADGVVVGSAVVAALEAGVADGSGAARVGSLVRSLREGVDGA